MQITARLCVNLYSFPLGFWNYSVSRPVVPALPANVVRMLVKPAARIPLPPARKSQRCPGPRAPADGSLLARFAAGLCPDPSAPPKRNAAALCTAGEPARLRGWDGGEPRWASLCRPRCCHRWLGASACFNSNSWSCAAYLAVFPYTDLFCLLIVVIFCMVFFSGSHSVMKRLGPPGHVELRLSWERGVEQR